MNHSNVLGAKTARPCDSCLIKRARWFCAADDAFLCQSCDAAVHSANQLAGRHQRLRLDTSSCTTNPSPPPAWHQGFTKKARTPRGHSNNKAPPSRPSTTHQLPLVPEIGADDAFPEENDEQLFCRVPVFDEFGAEGVGTMVFDDDDCRELDLEELLGGCEAEFAAGLLDEIDDGVLLDGKRVKMEDEGVSFDAAALDVEMNWELDCTAMMEEMKEEEGVKTVEMENENENERKRMLLRLNYEAVIAAWASQGSPWTDGIRPHFNLDEFMAACSEGGRKWAGREARVSRYREKRRTRLFSKKIRYEVRKLNAEKRPRLKGRFVKRAPHFLTLPSHH